MTCKDLIYKTF